jgi:hypothetical protein
MINHYNTLRRADAKEKNAGANLRMTIQVFQPDGDKSKTSILAWRNASSGS